MKKKNKELLEYEKETGIKIILPNDIRNQLEYLKVHIRDLRRVIDNKDISNCKDEELRLDVQKKLLTIKNFRIFQ